MITYILAGTLIVLAIVTGIALASASRARNNLARYQATYPHTAADLKAARADTLSRSRRTVTGQVIEHLAPFCREMLTLFNPRELHFIGKPVDYVSFNGLDGVGEIDVEFVEIKTGTSRLNPNERRFREAIEGGRVSYRVVRLNTEPAVLPQIEEPDPSDGIHELSSDSGHVQLDPSSEDAPHEDVPLDDGDVMVAPWSSELSEQFAQPTQPVELEEPASSVEAALADNELSYRLPEYVDDDYVGEETIAKMARLASSSISSMVSTGRVPEPAVRWPNRWRRSDADLWLEGRRHGINTGYAREDWRDRVQAEVQNSKRNF